MRSQQEYYSPSPLHGDQSAREKVPIIDKLFNLELLVIVKSRHIFLSWLNKNLYSMKLSQKMGSWGEGGALTNSHQISAWQFPTNCREIYLKFRKFFILMNNVQILKFLVLFLAWWNQNNVTNPTWWPFRNMTPCPCYMSFEVTQTMLTYYKVLTTNICCAMNPLVWNLS